MLAIQFAIGTANDVVDASSDALGQPWKAIPAGYVSKRTAAVMAGLLAMVGLCLSALAGPAALIVGAAGLGLGMAYDLRLKLTPLAWLVYALALPLVPAYAWLGARKQLPPRFRVLAPMAFLAGGVLAIGNATADVGPDDLAGRPTAAGRLEGRAATVIVAAGTAIVFTAAAATFGRSGTARATRLGLAIGAAACGLGILSSTRPTTSLRRLGWACQTLGFAALAAGWLAGQAQD
jgi:4-hydroxybenzoate polyprenyltransferase